MRSQVRRRSSGPTNSHKKLPGRAPFPLTGSSPNADPNSHKTLDVDLTQTLRKTNAAQTFTAIKRSLADSAQPLRKRHRTKPLAPLARPILDPDHRFLIDLARILRRRPLAEILQDHDPVLALLTTKIFVDKYARVRLLFQFEYKYWVLKFLRMIPKKVNFVKRGTRKSLYVVLPFVYFGVKNFIFSGNFLFEGLRILRN